MIRKHPNCPECNKRMVSIGAAKADVRTALRKYTNLPTQERRTAAQAAQDRMREAIRIFNQHVEQEAAQ